MRIPEIVLILLGIYLIVLLMGSLIWTTHANSNFGKTTEFERWEKCCKPLEKINYVFPAQVIGCFLAEPIGGWER